jgi:hypothetical protein
MALQLLGHEQTSHPPPPHHTKRREENQQEGLGVQGAVGEK